MTHPYRDTSTEMLQAALKEPSIGEPTKAPMREELARRVANSLPQHANEHDKRPGPSVTGPVHITLPWSVLVSVNRRTGGMAGWTTREYRRARDAAALVVASAYDGPPIETPVRVRVSFHPPDRRGDPHNRTKALYDALELGGLLKDDKLIMAWEGATYEPSSDPRAEVTVTVLDMEGAA